ncbi:MAG: phosphonate ABC transporter, permease protein PhnE [Opitutales bacterium]|nr:phosphonate ABC transporter, permease protein PhnE [Opitutales bacterium]
MGDVAQLETAQHAALKPYGPGKKWRLLGRLFFVLLVVGLASWRVEVDLITLIQDLPSGLNRSKDFFNPLFSAIPELLVPALVLILLALIPTPIGVFLAIPVSFLASNNIVPSWVRNITRTFITIQRGIPEIVVMVLMTAAFGLGAYPGIMAITVGSIGMLAKLFADAIEEVDEKALESLECTGASKWQVVRYGIIPEVIPTIISTSIFRFEINMRQAGLLGAVGAGGLGYELSTSMLALEYERAAAVILMLLVLIFTAEKLSDWLRSVIFKGDDLK